MPIRTIATLAVAVLLGLIAVLLVRNYIGAARRDAGKAVASQATRPVVVAIKPIARGVALDPTLLKVAQYPAESVPAGAFATVEELTASPQGKRYALRPMGINEPLLTEKVTAAGGRANLSVLLTPGMRAVTLRSNEVAGVAGFVLPGDKVDVLLTRTVGSDDKASTITQALADNVRVLGVDQVAAEDASNPVVANAVTVEVTPDQAQAVSLAQSVGYVSLSLRHMGDEVPLTRRATTVADLGFGGAVRPRPAQVAAAPAVRRPTGPEVRVTRGVETAGYQVQW